MTASKLMDCASCKLYFFMIMRSLKWEIYIIKADYEEVKKQQRDREKNDYWVCPRSIHMYKEKPITRKVFTIRYYTLANTFYEIDLSVSRTLCIGQHAERTIVLAFSVWPFTLIQRKTYRWATQVVRCAHWSVAASTSAEQVNIA